MPTRIKGGGLWLTTGDGVEVCACGHLFTAHEDPMDDTAGACEVVNGEGACGCTLFEPVPVEKPAGPEEV